ncbi:MAG: hypothetical protein QM756_30675 [Polyangiaceae bacterium]
MSLLALLNACRKQPAPEPAPPPPPARPREVMLEAWLPEPQALWPRLRALSGSLESVLPRAPELAVAGFLGVSALNANSFDLGSPVVLSWLAGDAPGLVLGVHLQSGAELVAKLTTGSTPTHRAERRGPLQLLFSNPSPSQFAFAVEGDTLLVGPQPAVERVGDYVARGLARSAPTQGPIGAFVPGDSLKRLLVPALFAALQVGRAELGAALEREQATRGRPADLAEPAVLLDWFDAGLRYGLSLLSSAREARAELNLAEPLNELSLRLLPESQGAAQELAASSAAADAAPLESLPAASALAVLVRRTSGSAAGDLLQPLLAPRMSASDAKGLERGLADLDAGRGGWLSVALQPDLGVVFRGQVNDAARLRSALPELLPLLTRKPLSELFRGALPTLTRRPSEKLPDATLERATLTLSRTSRFELGALIGSERFVAGFAKADAASPLTATLAAEAGAGLGSDPKFGPLLGQIRDAAFVAVADLTRLGLSRGEPSAALELDCGPRQAALGCSLRASDAALRALVLRRVVP